MACFLIFYLHTVESSSIIAYIAYIAQTLRCAKTAQECEENMHRFLRAIGFNNITTQQEMKKLLGIIMDKPSWTKKVKYSNGNIYTEITKEFAAHTGITIRGEYDKLGFFHLEHYFPYCESMLVTSHEDVTINHRVDTSAFTGMCDDYRLGISMIFYLQNAVDYLHLACPENTPCKAKLSLSGLSLSGIIILGTEQNKDAQEKRNLRTHIRNQLIAKAKNGDQDAIDSLTVDEIDLSTRINKRIKTEDLYSIVETSFIPYGSESDNYSILGTILNWSRANNPYTNENIYELLINCNDVVMNISINSKDLVGEPMVGRRFKGTIWMQGHAGFLRI